MDGVLMARNDDRETLKDAKQRFEMCQQFEAAFRTRYKEDVKFSRGDSDNQWQWNAAVRQVRGDSPSLTINKVRQHNLQIINDIKRNKLAVKILPTGGEASYDSAKVYNGVIRTIEYKSNASRHYTHGARCAIEGGIGYWRVLTEYEDDTSFVQDARIRPINDPLMVYLDPDIQEPDGSDARFGFIFRDISKEEFERLYPGAKVESVNIPFDNEPSWVMKDRVRIAEYYYAEYRTDTLCLLPDNTVTYFSEVDEGTREVLKLDDSIPKRKLDRRYIRWCKIVGDTIQDKRDWPGIYIPIVRCVGEEIVIDGQLDRKGHTRYMKDAQRMYNYWTSNAAELVTLQNKVPYLVPAKCVEGFEIYWNNANNANYPYLPYNDIDPDTQRPLPAPQRQNPPVMAQGYIQGMQIASEELKMVSGQYDNSMGKAENETSGVAIDLRQQQGDIANYHFIDNLALAIQFTGKILLDLIPKIYDTKRIMMILEEDGTESRVTVDPEVQAAFQEQQTEDAQEVEQIFNPNVGKYSVQADVGPAYNTKRREAFAAISQIASQNQQVMAVAGDLLFKAADFPMADELAERIAKTIPDEIKGDGPSQEVQQMGMQLQQMQQITTQLMQQLADEKRNKDIEIYKAQTDRAKAFKEDISPEAMAVAVAQLVVNMLKSPVEQESPGEPGMPAGGGLPPV